MKFTFICSIRCRRKRHRRAIRCLGSTCDPLPTYKVSDIFAFVVADLSIPTVTAVIRKVSSYSQTNWSIAKFKEVFIPHDATLSAVLVWQRVCPSVTSMYCDYIMA